jgi:predicted pore-forming effector associated with SMODS systems
MKNSMAVRAIVTIVALVFVLGTWLRSGQLDLGWLKFFSIAVLVTTIAFTVWDLWLWRIRFIQLIPGVPKCINGTWGGVLTSFWINPDTGLRVDPKPAYLVVRQSSSRITVTLLTNESRSTSSLADVATIDGVSELTYLYLNQPESRFRDRSKIHHGSTVLIVSGSPAKRLKGRYWTDRDARGELAFTAWNKKTADDYEDAEKLFN